MKLYIWNCDNISGIVLIEYISMQRLLKLNYKVNNGIKIYFDKVYY